jgi:hypothetical protein
MTMASQHVPPKLQSWDGGLDDEVSRLRDSFGSMYVCVKAGSGEEQEEEDKE